MNEIVSAIMDAYMNRGFIELIGETFQININCTKTLLAFDHDEKMLEVYANDDTELENPLIIIPQDNIINFK